jgi:hypothetical protein
MLTKGQKHLGRQKRHQPARVPLYSFPQTRLVQPPPSSAIIQSKSQCACGGACPKCQAEKPGIQTKLKINEPGDKYGQ